MTSDTPATMKEVQPDELAELRFVPQDDLENDNTANQEDITDEVTPSADPNNNMPTKDIIVAKPMDQSADLSKIPPKAVIDTLNNEKEAQNSTDRFQSKSKRPVITLPAPKPPKEPRRTEPYHRILHGIPKWTTKAHDYEEGRQARQLKQWTQTAETWHNQETRLASKVGVPRHRLRFNGPSTFTTKKQEADLLLSTTHALATHTHPTNALPGTPPDIWSRLDKFEDQATLDSGVPKPTLTSLRDNRVGPEFWIQPEVTNKSGLPLHPKYSQAIHEFISRSDAVRAEIYQQDEDEGGSGHDELNTTLAGTLGKSDLAQFINPDLLDVNAWVPDTSSLAIVGRSLANDANGYQKDSRLLNDVNEEEEEVHEEEQEKKEEETRVAVDSDNTVEQDQEATVTTGPSVVIQEKSRTGDNEGTTTQPSSSCRLAMTCAAGERATSTLELHNNGTTVVYITWHRGPRVDHLGTRCDRTDRFYFDRRPTRLLPNEKKEIDIQFNATAPGIYTDRWEIHTKPQIATAPVLVCFRGTCTQEDDTATTRQQIEDQLEKRILAMNIKSWIYDIIRSVQSPPRPQSPVADYYTEEDVFQAVNTTQEPKLHYDERLVKQAKAMYSLAWQQRWTQQNHPAPPKVLEPSIRVPVKGKDAKKGKAPPADDTNATETEQEPFDVPESPDWNLTMDVLKDVLMEIEDERALPAGGKDWRTQESYLNEYNVIVTEMSNMSSAGSQPEQTINQDLAREVFLSMAERIAGTCAHARRIVGVPAQDMYIAPKIEEEPYVARVDISVSKGKKGKGKPDKGKKDTKKDAKAADAPQGDPPQPLDDDTAKRLAPLQYEAVKHTISETINDFVYAMMS